MSGLNKSYVLSLNERQARVLIRALDAYARSFLGQIQFALGDAYSDAYRRGPITGKPIDVDEYQDGIARLKAALFPELHQYSSYGIRSTEISETARTATDIHDVLRNRMAWTTRPEGGYTVDFDTPMHFSTEPLPKCEVRQI